MTSFKQLILLSLGILYFQPSLFARTKVQVQKKPDIQLEGPSVPSRAPSREDSSIEIYLDNSSLYIESFEQLDCIYYSITQEGDSSTIISGYLSGADNEFVIVLANLGTGSYSLSLQINDDLYYGMFVIE